MNSYIRAINNYNRALESTKALKPTANPKLNNELNVLKQGDNIEIITLSSQAKPTFPEILSEMVTAETRKIEKAGKKISDVFKVSPKGEPMGANLVELAEALNATEIALLQVTAIRDKFVNAYQEIIKMPF